MKKLMLDTYPGLIFKFCLILSIINLVLVFIIGLFFPTASDLPFSPGNKLYGIWAWLFVIMLAVGVLSILTFIICGLVSYAAGKYWHKATIITGIVSIVMVLLVLALVCYWNPGSTSQGV